MALLKLRLAAIRLFGRFPKTEEIENNDSALRQEFSEFKNFPNSAEYKRYAELKQYVASGEPERVKKELHQLSYKTSPEFKDEQDFKKIASDKVLKNYFRIANSDTLNFLSNTELTGKPTRLQELKRIVESEEYRAKRAQHKKDQTDEYQREIEYNSLRGDGDLKRYLKLKQSTPVKDFYSIEGSETLAKYNALKEKVESTSFLEQKKYLLSKNKFEQSEARLLLNEFKALEKSEKIIWYNKVNGTDRFKEIERWELTYSDEFDSKELNKGKWLTRYF